MVVHRFGLKPNRAKRIDGLQDRDSRGDPIMAVFVVPALGEGGKGSFAKILLVLFVFLVFLKFLILVDTVVSFVNIRCTVHGFHATPLCTTRLQQEDWSTRTRTVRVVNFTCPGAPTMCAHRHVSHYCNGSPHRHFSRYRHCTVY